MIGFMLSSVLTALTCFSRCCSGLMICSTHLDGSAARVKSCAAITSLCTLGSWTVCLTACITGARCTVLEASLLIANVGNKTAPITVAVWRPPGYKYLLRSSPRTISHSFPSSLSCLGFPSLVLGFPTMEGKRGIKRERSPSAEGNPVAGDAKTPPSAPSGTPSPPGSLSEVSSHCPRSPVFE
jgi:hypothetical protein